MQSCSASVNRNGSKAGLFRRQGTNSDSCAIDNIDRRFILSMVELGDDFITRYRSTGQLYA
jgi:hypothetical protein